MACAPRHSIETAVTFGSVPREETGSPSLLCTLASRVLAAESDSGVLTLLRRQSVDLLVIHETVSETQGLSLVARVRLAAPGLPIVVLAAEPEADAAVQFIRAGAHDYFRGPLVPENLPRLEAAVRNRRGLSQTRDPQFFAPECPASVSLAGQSQALRRTLEMIRRVAKSHLSPILILGETGTGKELAARAIHLLRGGLSENFVAVNCATLTPTLLESELFGHMKGAFTGADRDKAGLFEMAAEGTIFLDEISEMPVSLQAKLLRVLQEKEYRRVGGTRNIPCRATIIASSNRDLGAESRNGRFRADLYYRLAVFPVIMPPLRDAERRQDILLLADYFIRTSAGEGPARTLSEPARQKLLRHDWPGNVRELRNVVDRALILASEGEITPEALIIDGQPSTPPASGAADVPAKEFSLETAERLFILRALEEASGQRTQAARLLGITRATLHAKLKRYRITVPETPNATPAAVPSIPPASRLQEAFA
jgi:DNA-binding NtrC family response regulator